MMRQGENDAEENKIKKRIEQAVRNESKRAPLAREELERIEAERRAAGEKVERGRRRSII